MKTRVQQTYKLFTTHQLGHSFQVRQFMSDSVGLYYTNYIIMLTGICIHKLS